LQALSNEVDFFVLVKGSFICVFSVSVTWQYNPNLLDLNRPFTVINDNNWQLRICPYQWTLLILLCRLIIFWSFCHDVLKLDSIPAVYNSFIVNVIMLYYTSQRESKEKLNELRGISHFCYAIAVVFVTGPGDNIISRHLTYIYYIKCCRR